MARQLLPSFRFRIFFVYTFERFSMETRVQKWGNSLALRIPKRVCEEAGLKYNSRVNVILNERQIIIEAVSNEALCLDDLLDDITEENLHAEIATGPAVGAERW